MITLQDLLRLIAVVVGPLMGYTIGRQQGNVGVGIALAVVFLVFCPLVVEAPYRIAGYIQRRKLRKSSTEVLISSLIDDPRHFGRLNILRELRRREVDIHFELPRLISLLRSRLVIERAVADAAIREFFPEIGERLSRYNPFQESSIDDPIVSELTTFYPVNDDALHDH